MHPVCHALHYYSLFLKRANIFVSPQQRSTICSLICVSVYFIFYLPFAASFLNMACVVVLVFRGAINRKDWQVKTVRSLRSLTHKETNNTLAPQSLLTLCSNFTPLSSIAHILWSFPVSVQLIRPCSVHCSLSQAASAMFSGQKLCILISFEFCLETRLTIFSEQQQQQEQPSIFMF